MELLFDYDPLTRTTETFHATDNGDGFVIQSQQDVTAIVEQNKILRNQFTGHNRKSGVRWVGRIPLDTLFHMKRLWRGMGMSREEQDRELLKFLNDSENSAWRVDTTKL